jgi:hypothetical protein
VLTAAVYPDVVTPHAEEGRRSQCRPWSTKPQNRRELTGSATARILRERRTATVCLPPVVRTGADIVAGRGPDTDTGVGIGLGGATMLVHDAM